MVARSSGYGVGVMGEWGENAQTSSYKINKSYRSDVQHGGYSLQHYIAYLTMVKMIDLKRTHHKKNFFSDYVR